MSGYLYRIPRADRSTLQSTVEAVVGFPCTSFGGAAAWDFDPSAGPANLRKLQPVAAAAELSVAGDFGHAFGSSAEVRWRRRDQDHYDILVLADGPDAPAGAQPLGSEGGAWATSAPAGGKILVSGAGEGAYSVVAYCAANGAVQFLSYREVR